MDNFAKFVHRQMGKQMGKLKVTILLPYIIWEGVPKIFAMVIWAMLERKHSFFKGYLLYCILFFSILSLIIVDHCVSLSSLGEEVWEG